MLKKLVIALTQTIGTTTNPARCFKKQILQYYKHFYKLRNVIDNGNPRSIQLYKNILRRKFMYIDYNCRRQEILDLPPLSQEEMVTRIHQTLIFTFNSTVTKLDEFELISTFHDIAKYDNSTLEGKVMKTFLRMEYQAPNEIKYDFKYKWFKEFNDALEKVEAVNGANSTKKNKSKKMQLKYPMNYIGFQQYERTIMGLNESLGLCF